MERRKGRIMKIYWTQKSVPELRDLSGKQRRKVSRICHKRVFKLLQIRLLFFLTAIMASVGGMAAGYIVPNYNLWVLRWLIALPFPLPVAIIFAQQMVEKSRPCYKELIQEMKANIN